MIHWLHSGQFSDFTLKAAGEEWLLHRLQLAEYSQFFNRLFDGDWQDRTMMTLDLAALG